MPLPYGCALLCPGEQEGESGTGTRCAWREVRALRWRWRAAADVGRRTEDARTALGADGVR